MQQQHDRLVSGLSAVEGFIPSYAPGAQNVYTSTSMTDPNGAAKKWCAMDPINIPPLC